MSAFSAFRAFSSSAFGASFSFRANAFTCICELPNLCRERIEKRHRRENLQATRQAEAMFGAKLNVKDLAAKFGFVLALNEC